MTKRTFPFPRNTLGTRGIDGIRKSYHEGSFKKYEVSACISMYAEPFINQRRNLLAVTTPINGVSHSGQYWLLYLPKRLAYQEGADELDEIARHNNSQKGWHIL